LLLDGAGSPAWNMALDEALLDGYAAGPSRPPTVRLYGWAPPALSLGRGQDARTAHDAVFLRAEGIDLVRRPSGGAAVLHEHERTYSVVGRLREEPFPGGVLDTYRLIASALVSALRRLGIDARSAQPTAQAPGAARSTLCFAEVSQHEIAVGATKLVGSAQLRRRGAFLQHGSILLRAHPERAARAAAAAAASARFAGLEDLLGRAVALEEVDRAVVSGFETIFAAELRRGDLSDAERVRADWLRRAKHETREWVLEGRAPHAGAAPSSAAR